MHVCLTFSPAYLSHPQPWVRKLALRFRTCASYVPARPSKCQFQSWHSQIFCTRTHIPESPACVMFSCAKVAADHHSQSGSATVGGSTRYACFVITPQSLPKGRNPCRSLLRPWIAAALSRQKSLFFSYQSDSQIQNVPQSNAVGWNKSWSSLKGFGSSGYSGADFAPEQNLLQSEGVSLLSHDLFRRAFLRSLATFWVPTLSAFFKLASQLHEKRPVGQFRVTVISVRPLSCALGLKFDSWHLYW